MLLLLDLISPVFLLICSPIEDDTRLTQSSSSLYRASSRFEKRRCAGPPKNADDAAECIELVLDKPYSLSESEQFGESGDSVKLFFTGTLDEGVAELALMNDDELALIFLCGVIDGLRNELDLIKLDDSDCEMDGLLGFGFSLEIMSA